MSPLKCHRPSKWIAAILLLLCTHYLFVTYFTVFQPPSASSAPEHQKMAESINVYFPVNKQYYPEKSPPKLSRVSSRTNTSTQRVKTTPKPTTTSEPKTGLVTAKIPFKPYKSVDKSGKSKLILAWTVLTSRKPLWGIAPWTFKRCEYSNCHMTGNRSLLSEADLLIFRIRELKMNLTATPYRKYVRPIDISDLPPFHRERQLWMDINQESPVYTQADEEVSVLNGAFNLSSNYLINSDYSISYIPDVIPKQPGSAPADIDYSAGKTKMALWFVSHCSAASGRDEYVKELQKYNISVDVFGKCTGKTDGCAPGNITCYNHVRSKYKFYLAFENSICSEYITEKFWNTLSSNTYNIPIALGASVKEYDRFSPPNSFLHTRNFTSIKALAEFMHKLDGDSTAYNSYHKWRSTHEIVSRVQKESLQCYMCRQAHEQKDGKSEYKNIAKYWSRKNNCDLDPEPMR